MQWSDFHFLRPLFLWLLPLGVFAYLLPKMVMGKKSPWAWVVDAHLLPYVLREARHTQRSLLPWLSALFVILLVLALAGPTIKKLPLDASFKMAPLVVCLELSDHMMAADIEPNRLRRAIFKLEDLLRTYRGAEIALIGFAGDAHLVVPLSEDRNTVLSLAKTLNPSLMPVPGVSPGAALALAGDIVKRNPGAHILLMTSSNADQDIVEIRKVIRDLNAQVLIWPFATAVGAPLEYSDGRFERASGGGVRISKLRAELLDELAKMSQVKRVAFTSDDRDIRQIMASVENGARSYGSSAQSFDEWYDLGPYLLMCAVLLFIMAWFFLDRNPLWLGLILLLMPGYDIRAAGLKDWFLRRDQQAQAALRAGDAKKAAQLFEDDMRKGLAYLRANMMDEAISHLKKVDSSDGLYNLGNAYARNGQIAEAINAYGNAIKKNSANDDAVYNKKLLEDLLKDQEKQDQDKEQKQHQGKDQGKDQRQDEKNDQQDSPADRNDKSDQQENGDQAKKGDNEKAPEPASTERQSDRGDDQQEKQQQAKDSAEEKPTEDFKNAESAKPDGKDLDRQTRHLFEGLERNQNLYLKRKFQYESRKERRKK